MHHTHLILSAFLSLLVIFSNDLGLIKCDKINLLNTRANVNKLRKYSSKSSSIAPLSLEAKLSKYSGYPEWSSYFKDVDMKVLDKILHKCYVCTTSKQRRRYNGRPYDGNIENTYFIFQIYCFH
jgi:hypothetical protein